MLLLNLGTPWIDTGNDKKWLTTYSVLQEVLVFFFVVPLSHQLANRARGNLAHFQVYPPTNYHE